jgi:hypothetical protein
MTEPLNPEDLTDEEVIDIFTCEDLVEVTLVQDALREAGIKFLMRPDPEWDKLGWIDGDPGERNIAVLEEDVDRAVEILHNLFPDETVIEDLPDEEADSAQS